MSAKLNAAVESFAIDGVFTIARGSKTHAEVIRVTIERDGMTGQGECVPYARYGETVAGALETILALQAQIAGGLDRQGLQSALPPGAARNAIDCAFWDLEAKAGKTDAAAMAGITLPNSLVTAYTISLGTPEAMAAAVKAAGAYPLLKIKLGGDGDIERLNAVRAAAPTKRLVIDANEGWTEANLVANLAHCQALGIELVEQPLPAGQDGMLATIARAVPVCADESTHHRDGLAALVGRYDAINIKLDKTGGLTEALAMVADARALGLKLMAGCMVGTSLSMAPAMLVAASADWVDLDGPLLLKSDRPGGLRYQRGLVSPSAPLWGGSE